MKINCPKCSKIYEVSEENIGKKTKCPSCGEIFEIQKNNISQNEEKTENLELKPNKWSFIFFGSSLFFLLILLIISLIVTIFVKEAIIAFGILFFILILDYFLVNIAYKKEKYTINDKKIIYHYGTIFSDNSVEIEINKITQVEAVLGFFQYNIFKTGDLLIKTAGANNSKITLKNVEKTMNLYEDLQKRMRKNGFHLQKDKLVQEAKPHWLGVIGEVLGKSIGVLFAIFYIFAGVIFDRSLDEISEIGKIGNVGSIIFGVMIFAILIVILMVIFSYLDLKRRKYDVYTDSVFYTEGFLTKNFSFLPMEKISDIENNQSFWSKIFGLHDVVVSSEGASNKVIFKNMTSGEQMMKNIKYLKNNITMTKSEIISEKEKEANDLIGFVDKTEEPLDYNKDFTASYKMNFVKTFYVSLIFIILGIITGIIFGFGYASVFIIFAFSYGIGLIISFLFTNYIVDNSTIESKFSFLTNKHNSFSIEKITGVVIRESILDIILKTCSITFWSIGSSSSITFKNIKKDKDLEKNILSKVGIYREKKSENIAIAFNFLNFLKANIGVFIFFVILFLIFVLVLFLNSILGNGEENLNIFYVGLAVFGVLIFLDLISFFYKKFYYSKKFYSQKVYEDFIYSKSGIFFRGKYFVLNRNIKGTKSKKYPLTKAGNIEINVSGEQVSQGQNGQNISISNSLGICYIKDVFGFHNIFDDILTEDKLNTEIVKSSKQDVGNSIIFVGIFTILILIGLFAFKIGAGNEIDEKGFWIIVILTGIIFFIIIGFIIWAIKVKYYNLEKDRIILGSGIIYKKRKSILYKKFNFVSKNQGFFGKIFRNGVINIYTLGSGSIDMSLADTSDFKEIYGLLKRD